MSLSIFSVDKNDPPHYGGEMSTKAKVLHLIRSIRLVTKSMNNKNYTLDISDL